MLWCHMDPMVILDFFPAPAARESEIAVDVGLGFVLYFSGQRSV
jgi:hypothetical protein